MRLHVPALSPVVLASAAALFIPCTAPQAQAREPDVECASATFSDRGPAPSAQYLDYRSRLHSFATGAGIRVAVIDTGVADHPQIRVVPGQDFVTPAEPDPLRDCDLHGTVVAGVIAGRELGVAPDAEIYSIRQTSAHYRSPSPQEDSAGEDSDSSSGTLATLAAAIEDAVEAKAKVINVSVVSCVPPEAAERVDRSRLDAALARAEDEGVVVVAASGNATSGGCEKGDVVFPAEGDTVLAVGALETPHDLAGYSLAAPLSAEGAVPLALAPGGGWATAKGDVLFQGTSFAAPLVSGTVALLAQRYPADSAAQLRARVVDSAEPGHGVVDPLTAVTYRPATGDSPERSVNISPAAAETSPRWARVRWLLAGAAALSLLAACRAASPGPRVRPRG